ncbi:MAG: site-2 protease family protein [Leptolyngbyaceae cyanobacterium RU_5_1]|nr:site-2 protease family protein [Leptolyngbyaceae cyanobacterium RU_5_1]
MWVAGIVIFLGWTISVCLHEFGHAVVAYWGGDTSVKEKGYLTLNPLKYTDPQVSLLFPLIFLLMGGIALPGGAVYINHNRLRDRVWKSAVSAAGPVTNSLLVLLLAIPFQLGWIDLGNMGWFEGSLAFLILLQASAVVLNLLPIPSLDGYGIIEPWLPERIQNRLNKIGSYGLWIIFGLFLFVPAFSRAFWQFVLSITDLVGIPRSAIALGSDLFHAPITKLFLIVGLIGALWLLKQSGRTQGYRSIGSAGDRPVMRQNRRRSHVKSNRTPGWQLFPKDAGITPLRKQLLNLVKQRQETAEQLVALEKAKNPGKPERWYLEKIIYDLRRGR